jgi:DNA polymerase-3 subunit delta'
MRVASRTAERGAHKVLRIIDADRMNDAAANAFLKALEEPPERTLWVLELADPDELPDTILSRCRVLRMAPWDRATMRDAVVRHGATLDADGELAVRVATGAPGRLRTLLGPRGLQDVRSQREIPRQLRAEGPGFALVASRDLDDQMKAAIGAVRDEAAHEREQLAELYGDAPPRDVLRQIEQRATRREREVKTVVAQTALDDLAGWYRDVLLVRCGGDPGDAVHADDADGLRADARAMSQRVLLASLEAIFARREELEFNVQLGLLYEALLLELSTLALEG